MADAVALVGRLRRAVPTLEAAEVVLADGAALVAECTGVAPVLDPIPPVQVVVEAVGPPDPAAALAADARADPGSGTRASLEYLRRPPRRRRDAR